MSNLSWSQHFEGLALAKKDSGFCRFWGRWLEIGLEFKNNPNKNGLDFSSKPFF
jgi:hypothetical protein